MGYQDGGVVAPSLELGLGMEAEGAAESMPAPNFEGGEASVQDFVRLHMMSILQPFADRVHELQAHVEHLAEEIASAHGASESHRERLNRAEQQLTALQEASANSTERADKAQAELSSLRKDKSRLEGNHEMTKASVAKAKEQLTQLTASMEGLQLALDDTCLRVGTLERGLPEAEQRLGSALEARLDRQGKLCKELNDKQTEMQRACQQARALGESASAAVKELQELSGQQLKQEGFKLGSLSETITELEARVKEAEERVQKHDAAFEAVDREVAHLRTWSGQVAELKKAQAEHSAAMQPLAEHPAKLQQLESQLLDLCGDAAKDRQLQAAELGELEKRLQQSLADVVRWRDTQKAQCDIISTAGKRLDELESGQAQLSTRAEHAASELNSLDSWRLEATATLGTHGRGLEAAQAGLKQTQERLEGTSAGLQSLRGQVGTDREALQRLSSRVDTCCTYFSGLGKGLQDTHRQVVDNGLLAPKPTVLPAIPRGPKTPRSSLSPRK